MNAKNKALVNNVNLAAEGLQASEAALQEQLALKRLREAIVIPPERRWQRQGNEILRQAGALLVGVAGAMLIGGELVQQVAPNRPPLRRHEWERVMFRPQF